MSERESVKRFSCRQVLTLTSLQSALIAKKSMKMKCSADKKYYNFSHEDPKIRSEDRPSTPSPPSPPSPFSVVCLRHTKTMQSVSQESLTKTISTVGVKHNFRDQAQNTVLAH